MKTLITTLIFILTASVIRGQEKDKTIFVGNVVSDTASFKNKGNQSPFTSILKSNYKIEIRFTTTPSFDYTNYKVITYDKNWSAKQYYYVSGNKNLLSKDIESKVSIDSVFSRLVLNNIFSLPDQDSLVTEKYEYNLETNEFIGLGMSVCDGACYSIEFKVGDYFRRYVYCNPESYADFYPNVYELRSFANIVNIFTESFK